MRHKHLFLLLGMMNIAFAMNVNAQGNNSGLGGHDSDETSLAERVLKLEKHNDAFNVYLNFSSALSAKENEGEWNTGFAAKQLRLEFVGNLTEKLFYRLRHRLNKDNKARGTDNFAKATDIMMVGYHITPKFTVTAGKLLQGWGGYEYDENPLYIYQFSDFCDRLSTYSAGVAVAYKPHANHEFTAQVANTFTGSFGEEYGSANAVAKTEEKTKVIREARNPLMYVTGWNGSFFNGKLTTRWAVGMQTLARGEYSRVMMLGQQLNLNKLQWYVDYMGAGESMDRLGVVTDELQAAGVLAANTVAGKVHYNSWVSKLNWQFAPQWNVMCKGMMETANMQNVKQFKNYRTAYGYVASVEYYPVKTQPFRIYLAYIGRNYKYSKDCGLKNTSTNRIELGFMARIKAF